MSDGLGVCILPKSTAIYMLGRQLFSLLSAELPATARPRSSPQAPHLVPQALAQSLMGQIRLIFFLSFIIVLSYPMAGFYFI